MNTGWSSAVINPKSKEIDRSGYTLCAIDNLQANLRSRDIYIEQSERWCDPRAKLLKGVSWEKNKNPVCRTLNLSADFDEVFEFLSTKLDNTYQAVIESLPKNDAVEIVKDSKIMIGSSYRDWRKLMNQKA